MKIKDRKPILKQLVPGVAALVLALVAAGAQAIPLSALMAGGSITVDDKLFHGWEVVFNNPGAPPVDLDLIEVIGDASDPLNPGLIFQANGGALSVAGDFLTLDFGFQVTVLDPNMRVKDNTLSLDGFSIAQGLDNISIEETVCSSGPCFPGSPDELAFKNVYADLQGSQLLDVQNFALQTDIWIEKFLYVDGIDGFAEITQFSQYFSQEPARAPEPGTLALFALGLIGVAFGRRRHS